MIALSTETWTAVIFGGLALGGGLITFFVHIGKSVGIYDTRIARVETDVTNNTSAIEGVLIKVDNCKIEILEKIDKYDAKITTTLIEHGQEIAAVKGYLNSFDGVYPKKKGKK